MWSVVFFYIDNVLTTLNCVFLWYLANIESHKGEMNDIERNIRNMQNDMTKLNLLINKEAGMKDFLQQSNVLMENDFIQTLKVCDCSDFKSSWL